MIPYGRQDITDEDVDAVIKTLKSDFLTQGPVIEEFEKKFAAYCGVKYAVAISSCTAGLHLACLALDLGRGGKLWTVPNTFVASANCGLYCGADVDFVDIDPDTWNISVPALEEKFKAAQASGTLPDILVPVHFSGQSCDMKAIKALSDRYGFKIVEDAAHCTGASYDGRKVGDCRYSDMAVFSLHPVKIITTGEGGVITTNSEETYKRLLRLRTHGITRNPAEMTRKPDGPWYFEQLDLGYHYRITDIQAALGLSQMARMDGYVKRRQELVARYNKKLAGLKLKLPTVSKDCVSSWHLYVVRVDASRRREIFDKLRADGIGANVHYIPVHTHPYFKELGFKEGMYPEGERYYAEAITLPLYPALTEEQQDYICDRLAAAL